MSKEGQIDTLNHTIYETALDAGRWPSALQQLAVYLDAATSHFIVWDKQANAVSFSVVTGIPPEADASYGAYYAAIENSPWPTLPARGCVARSTWMRISRGGTSSIRITWRPMAYAICSVEARRIQ